MARTKATRRLPPFSFYEAQWRSHADVAARVAPTLHQFQLAVDFEDEPTILDYLNLAPTLHHDLDETNAYITLHSRLPPRPQQRHHARPGDTGNGHDEEAHAPHTWLWPHKVRQPLEPTTLFMVAARNGLVDILTWFFCGPRSRVERFSALLLCVFPRTMREAVNRRRGHVVEMLLTSRVFYELLSAEAQQRVLDEALSNARDASLCQALLAHGATTCGTWYGTGDSLAIGCFSGFLVGAITEQLWCDLWYHRDNGDLARVARHGTAIDHSVLVKVIQDTSLEGVKRLLDTGFVDVDARRSDGRTALMVCATGCGLYPTDARRAERTQILRMLLETHADTTLRDSQGHTALHIAIEAHYVPCVELLLDHTIAMCGIEAVHSDHEALAIALERRDAHGEASQRVVAALLERGACTNVYDSTVSTSVRTGPSVWTAHFGVAAPGEMVRRSCQVCGPSGRDTPEQRKRRRIEDVLLP